MGRDKYLLRVRTLLVQRHAVYTTVEEGFAFDAVEHGFGEESCAAFDIFPGFFCGTVVEG